MATTTELQTFAEKTTFDIPNVDYQVGIPSGTQLRDYRSIASQVSGVRYDAVNDVVYVDGNNVNLTGYDFSGANVVVRGNNATFTNCKFDAAQGYYALRQANGASGMVVDHCLFDGLRLDNLSYARLLDGGTGQMTVRYSVFKDAPGDIIAIQNGTIDHNYLTDAGFAKGAHADAIWVGRTTGPVTITNNFVDMRENFTGAQANQAVRVNDEMGSTSNVTVSNNVLLGATYTVSVTDTVPGNSITGVVVTDNMITSGLFGALYPANKPADMVYSGNQTTGFSSWLAEPPPAFQTGVKLYGSVQIANEVLTGTDLADHIYGSGGGDVLIGAGGRDFLFGGRGAETFKYLAVNDSTAARPDIIGSFERGIDKIDLRDVDANGPLSGKQDFNLVTGFTRTAGELVLNVQPVVAGTNYVTTRVEGDINGDGVADFRIDVQSSTAITASDLLLASPVVQRTIVAEPPVVVTEPAPDLARITAAPAAAETRVAGGTSVSADAKTNFEMLVGSNGSDHFYAQGNSDVFLGLGGRDYFFGKAGRDFYAYRDVSDSTMTRNDIIGSFEVGIDKIDLRAVDANSQLAGDQAFSFVGSAAFSGRAGELHVVESGKAGAWFAEVDVNGDRLADMRIEVQTARALTAGDFLL